MGTLENSIKNRAVPHILIADDDQPSLILMEILIQSLGYQATLVSGGREVLPQVSRSKPDMILLDLHLPDMDGFEIFAHLKNNPNFAKIPIIFITADADVVKKGEALNIGCSDYITKPYDIGAVKIIIQSHLEKIREGDT